MEKWTIYIHTLNIVMLTFPNTFCFNIMFVNLFTTHPCLKITLTV